MKFYLSKTKEITSESILLNNFIPGRDKGGLAFTGHSRDFKIENNSVIGGGSFGAGGFTIKSTQLPTSCGFLRYKDFADYFVKENVFLIAENDAGTKNAYIEATPEKTSVADLQKSDSLDSSFSVSFISPSSTWRTSYFLGSRIISLHGGVRVDLTELQTTDLKNRIQTRDFYFKIYINEIQNLYFRYKLKSALFNLASKLSFVFDLKNRIGYVYSGSGAILGNIIVDVLIPERIQDTIITGVLYEISSVDRGVIIEGLNYSENIEAEIFDFESIQ